MEPVNKRTLDFAVKRTMIAMECDHELSIHTIKDPLDGRRKVKPEDDMLPCIKCGILVVPTS